VLSVDGSAVAPAVELARRVITGAGVGPVVPVGSALMVVPAGNRQCTVVLDATTTTAGHPALKDGTIVDPNGVANGPKRPKVYSLTTHPGAERIGERQGQGGSGVGPHGSRPATLKVEGRP
jgi:hypothetical protein